MISIAPHYRKSLIIVVAAAASLLVVALLILVAVSSRNASAISGSDFNAGRIIDDSVFYNGGAMNSSQVQNFLNSKVPTCDTNGTMPATDWGRPDITHAQLASYIRNGTNGYTKNTNYHAPPYVCLRNYKQNTPQMEAASGLCGGLSAKSNRTAAQIITDVAAVCGINPQVLIVLLEKEQSLITDNWPLQRQYRSATGFDCPDSAPCDPAFAGFFYQVYHAARQFKVYKANPNSYNYVAGRTNKIYWQVNLGEFVNPTGNENDPSKKGAACGHSNVYIQNQATAALYIYTPYRPNQKALANLNGTGDGCSAYGNRNFWRLFTQWFGSTTGSVFFKISGSSREYILGANNRYYYIPSPELKTAYGWGKSVTSVTTRSSSYLNGKTYAGKLSPVARFEDDSIYLVDQGRRYHFTRSTLLRYGYDIGDESQLPSAVGLQYPQSGSAQPVAQVNDGSGTVYYLNNGTKRHFSGPSAYRSGTPAYSTLGKVGLSYGFLRSVKETSPIFSSGTLFRINSGSAVYVVNTEYQKITIPSRDTMNEYGYSMTNVRNISSADAALYASLPQNLSPYIKNSSGTILLVTNGGKKHVVPTDLYIAYGVVPNNVQVVSNSLIAKLSAAPELTEVIKSPSNNNVYRIVNGKKQLVRSPSELRDLGFSGTDVTVVSASFLNRIPTL